MESTRNVPKTCKFQIREKLFKFYDFTSKSDISDSEKKFQVRELISSYHMHTYPLVPPSPGQKERELCPGHGDLEEGVPRAVTILALLEAGGGGGSDMELWCTVACLCQWVWSGEQSGT